MKPEHQVLIDARKLIEKPGTWTQGFIAQTALGRQIGVACSPTDTGVVRRCMVGAVHAASSDGYCGPGSQYTLAVKVLKSIIGGSPSKFNDAKSTTHPKMLAVMDSAIEATA